MSPILDPRMEYVPPNPNSRRCRMGIHVPTFVPRDVLASLAAVGAYKPGRLAADSSPWPGGYCGSRTFKWCTRCGAELEPEQVAESQARAREAIAEIIRKGREANGLCTECYDPHPLDEPHTDDAEALP